MSLAITSKVVSGNVVVALSGRLSVLETGLAKHIKECLEERHRRFIVDLAALTYIDSSGLGQLITAWVSIRNQGGQLIVLRPTPRVRELLHITKLDSVFHIVEDEAEAITRMQTTFAAAG